MNGLFFVKENTLRNFKKADVALDSRQNHMKIKADADPEHLGVFEYVFGSTHDNGEFLVLEVEHGFDYTPCALVRRQTKGQDSLQYLTTVLSQVIPSVKEWVWYYRCDEDSLKVYYKQTNGTVGNPYANTTQQIIYEMFANPGNQDIIL